MHTLPKRASLVALAVFVSTAAACGGSSAHKYKSGSTTNPARLSILPGIHKIKHVVVIMQENRSFDSYFGTYPGADGIPMRNGIPTVCIPDPARKTCDRPFHDPSDRNIGGPHGQKEVIADVDGGKMDGFIASVERVAKCSSPTAAGCSKASQPPDVIGYHDFREIPNYWKYAANFVLQDRMFEPTASSTLPAHLFMVSEWSAFCPQRGIPMNCVNDSRDPSLPPPGAALQTVARLCLDGPHLSAAQSERELGLLRLQGSRARL